VRARISIILNINSNVLFVFVADLMKLGQLIKKCAATCIKIEVQSQTQSKHQNH
jgi:hypothetical protein